MRTYIINEETQEVHIQRGCQHQPTVNMRILGYFNSLNEAILEARRRGFARANRCEYCF